MELYPPGFSLTKEMRESLNPHKGAVVWFTGLSGSGKSTLANRLEVLLNKRGCRTYLLDGDSIRRGLNRDLGFSNQDRRENIRRCGEVAKLFQEAGIILLASFISPFEEDREAIRNSLEPERFMEIFLDCPLSECEKRDTKGLYKKARAGLLKDFTGIDSPYEKPRNPDMVLKTGEIGIEEGVDRIISLLIQRRIIL